MKSALSLAALAVSVAASALWAGCRPVTPTTGTPHITTTNPDDIVTIARIEDVTVVDVTSPRGIGAAQVRFSPVQANAPIQVRFHLQGLEQATFDNGAAQLTVSVSSQPPYPVAQTLTSAGMTVPLSEDDALWAAVTLAPNDAALPTIPLASGAIVIALPPAFIEAQHSDLSLHWIDFFR
jgi:hypothetical protein